MYGYNPNVWQDTGSNVPMQGDNAQVTSYVDAYRRHGYKYADLNPVAQTPNQEKGYYHFFVFDLCMDERLKFFQ